MKKILAYALAMVVGLFANTTPLRATAPPPNTPTVFVQENTVGEKSPKTQVSAPTLKQILAGQGDHLWEYVFDYVGEAVEGKSAATATPTVEQNPLHETELAILNHINVERARLGLGRLEYDAALSQAAMVRSEELFTHNHWAHTRPDGRDWITVLTDDVPYSYTLAGENLAYFKTNDFTDTNYIDGHYWYDLWRNSPGHYENMCREPFTKCGVAVYTAERDGVRYTYATTLFAKPQE